MSTKKQNSTNSVDTSSNKTKGAQRNKNRRRSTRITSNGDIETDVTKDRSSNNNIKRGKEANSKCGEEQEDLYKDIIDLVPSTELNCSPNELPAPPGTRVNLHGVILHETEGGLIVLNVRWRNKVYSGALIDVEKSKWATDRVADCNGGDCKDFQAPPPIKKIKIPTTNQNLEDAEYTSNKKRITSPTTPSKTKSRANGKKRNNQDRAPSPLSTIEESVPGKKQKIKVTNQNGSSLVVTAPVVNNTDNSLECPEPNCGKKYKTKNSLTYHIRRIHQKSDSLDDSGKENKSESHDESDSGDDQLLIDEQIDEDSKNDVIGDKQNGSQSEDDNSEENGNTKKEELTENEKQIEKLRLETDKTLATLMLIKKEKPEIETISQKKDENSSESDLSQDDNKPLQKIKEEIINEKLEYQDLVVPTPSSVVERENSTDTIIDVENTKTAIKETDDKKPVPSIQVTAAPPLEQIQQPISNTIKVEEEIHPRGSSKTIFQQDPNESLTQLFALPNTHNFPQYSPTLGQLNPQKINESLTEALSKQDVKNVAVFNKTATSKLEVDSIKSPLTPKPSIEIKPTIEAKITQLEQDKNNKMVNPVNNNDVNTKPFDTTNPNINTNDVIADSDNEDGSDSLNEILINCSEIYPQNDRDVKAMTMFTNELHPMFNPSFPLNIDKKTIFEKLNKEGGLSILGLPKNVTKFQDFILPNPVDLYQSFLNQTGNRNNEENKAVSNTGGQFPILENQIKLANRTPLLNERLLSKNISQSSPVANKMLPLTTSAQNILPLSRQMSKEELLSNELKISTEKVIPANIVSSRDRNFEKQKSSPGNLRINPPNKITGSTWIPEISKDSFNAPPTSFRVPATKSLSIPGNPVSLVNDPKLAQIKAGKRPNQPVPIAPAPVPGNPISRSEYPQSGSEYTSPDGLEKDSPLFSCFTLTSDKRLISSTPDNRGRPRKLRPGKISQLSIGSHQELGKIPSVGEMGLSRKPSASPVVRASVIQGSTHPTLEGPTTNKSPERMTAEAHAMLARNFENVDERFLGHPSQAKNPVDIRNNEKYKTLSSPPGMYYGSPQPRNLLSPQNQRPSSRSPRQDFPRASPNIKSDLLREPSFHQRAMEHPRTKPDHLHTPDPMLIQEATRKHSLSPHEAMQMMTAFKMREMEKEFHNPQSRFHNQRHELPHGQDIPNALLERRYMPSEKEHQVRLEKEHQARLEKEHQARLEKEHHARLEKEHHARILAAAERERQERLLRQSPLTQGAFQRNTSPPSTTNEPSGHPNLFLERRDGGFLGPVSSFPNRSNEPHKR